MPTPAPAPTAPRRGAALLGSLPRAVEVGLLLGGALLLLFSPRSLGGDGWPRFEALNALLNHGEVSPVAYSLVGPLFSSPLWLLGQVWPQADGWVALFNRLVFLGGLFALARLLGPALPARTARHFLLLLVFASMFPHHIQYYFGEVFTSVLVAVGIAAVCTGRGWWGWVCLVLGVANMPAALVGLALVAGWCALEARRGRYLLAVPAALALILLESFIRRGHPLVSGYEDNRGFATILPYSGRPGFSYPMFFGLLSILLSFGKGILFYAPGLLLPLSAGAGAERARAAWWLWLLFLAGLVLVYARWWAWYGGWFWGPRFFLFASIPAALTLAIALQEAPRQSLGRNLLALTVLALSFWVGLSGLLFGQDNLGMCTEKDYALEHLCWYAPEFSALWRPFVVPTNLPTNPAPPPCDNWLNDTSWALTAVGLYVGCFCYLVGPLAVVCARQAWAALRPAWSADRGAWRF